uniref:hypothetical protein n=1 Tax=Gelidibacter sp. TaxID=2018083 RepID=UPI004048EBC8
MTLNKNTIALTFTGIITIGFFVAGLFDVLDYFIVKLLLFISFALLIVYLILMVLKQTSENKNHPEHKDSE